MRVTLQKVASDADPALHLSPESYARFARFITAELGIRMPECKITLVQSRLLRRVRELGLGSVERYSEYFFADGHKEEREHFINVITTNKTDFFREPEHFDFLTRTALPSLGKSRLKVWSAGCSSGEEPYTLAIVLSEYLAQQPGADFAILGTDVSTKVLSHARAAIYQVTQVECVPPHLRMKYLLASRDRSRQQVRIRPELRRRIAFHQLNLMDEDYGISETFDVVFFRNVMIYFDKPTQEAVINKLCRNLAVGGYLFVGHSESLAGLDIPVEPLRASIYRKPV
jgi:chemotaxis protein methyltransferase CheR